MNAGEIIAELSKLPPDTPVVFKLSQCEYGDVIGVELKRAYYRNYPRLYSNVEFPSDWNKRQVARLLLEKVK